MLEAGLSMWRVKWSCRESNPGPNWDKIALSTRLVILVCREPEGESLT